MKPSRQVVGPNVMEVRAAELSQLFAEAGWTQSVQNFEPRPFVIFHGAWFSAAGSPPGLSCHAISCRTPEEVIAFLGSIKAPEPNLQVEPAPTVEAPPPAPQPDPRDGELASLRERIAELSEQLAAKPTEVIVEKIVERIVEVAPVAPSEEDVPLLFPPDPGFAKLSDFGDVGEGSAIITKEEVDELLNMDETDAAEVVKAMKGDRRKRFTELLHAEFSELHNRHGMAGEDLPREAAIEGLLGLFARLGEI